MAKSTENFRIRPCDVYYNGQLLGYTKGGVTLTVEREFVDLTADEFGEMTLDKALQGNNMMVKVPLAEPTIANLAKAIPEGRFDQPDTDDTGKLGIGRKAGYLLSQDAVELRLHPRNNEETDTSEDIWIWKAVSVEAVELDYKVDEQQVVEITYQALADTNRVDGRLLGRIGDEVVS